MNRNSICWIGIIIWGGWCWAAPGAADVLYLKNGEVIFGRVESEEPEHVLFRQRMAGDNNYRERVFRLDQIDSIHPTVAPGVLESLAPGRWQQYRDLAETLETQQRDPEARDLARRLYLLVARHGAGDLQVAGFRGALATSDREQEQPIRALAWQTLGQRDWLTASPPEAGGGEQPERERLRVVALGLKSVRNGKLQVISELLKQEDLATVLQPFAGICTVDQLRQMDGPPGITTPPLSLADQARLLRLELAIQDFFEGQLPAPVTAQSPWSVLIHQPARPLGLVQFEQICGFDPEATLFREGAWRRP